jgi:hypothetical protein
MKGKIELLVFPKVLERIASLWEEEKVIVTTGRLSDKDGVYKLIVDDAKEINQAELENTLRIEATKAKHNNGGASIMHDGITGSEFDSVSESNSGYSKYLPNKANPPAGGPNKLVITLPDDATPEMIQKLTGLFNTCKTGICKVFLHHQANKLETPFSIEHDSEISEKIKSIVQEGTIEII